MTELLPCPFCGGEGRWNWNHDYILCGSCDIAVRPSIWATRTAPAKGEKVQAIDTNRDEACSKCGIMPAKYADLTRYCKSCAPTPGADRVREAGEALFRACERGSHGEGVPTIVGIAMAKYRIALASEESDRG